MQISGKKICIVVYGVVDYRSVKTARALAAAGAIVTLLSFTHTRKDYSAEPFTVIYCDPCEPKGSEIALRPLRIFMNLTVKRLQKRFARRRDGFFGSRRVAEQIIDLQPDVVHAINSNMLAPCAQAAQKMAVPYIYESYEFWPDHACDSACALSLLERNYLVESEEEYARKASMIITVSPYLAASYKDQLNLEREPEVIFNAPPAHAEVPTKVHSPLKVLFLGNLQAERNIDLLFQAAQQVENIELTFQGSGPMREKLITRITQNRLEGRMFLKPPVPYDLIASSASQYDVGVVCHKAYDRQMNGALPNKFFEYLSGGLAIVASETEAFKSFQYFKDFGIYINPESTDSMVKSLEFLAENPQRVGRMKQAALRESAKYCGSASAEKIVGIYESLGEVHSS